MSCKNCPYLQENFCVKICDDVANLNCYEKDGDVKRRTYQNPRKLNRYERNKKYKNKLKKLVLVSRYPSGAFYKTSSYFLWDYTTQSYKEWAKENCIYIKRCYRANHAPGRSGLLKKQASRKFRHYKGELANGCAYKKTFDYWWELI